MTSRCPCDGKVVNGACEYGCHLHRKPAARARHVDKRIKERIKEAAGKRYYKTGVAK